MNSRLIPIFIVFGTALAWAATAGAQQQDFSKIEITTQSVADGIYMMQGSGGNIGVLVGEDGVVLIDDQYGPLTDKITAAVAKISDQPIRMIINTHWHGDHTGGNENLAKAGALIIAQDNVRRRMSRKFFSEFFQSEVPASPAAALPVVTFDRSVSLHLNGHTVRAEHVPAAHTDGDAIIWFEEANVVHMGDTYFEGFYPFIDRNSGGSIRGMIAAIDTALTKIDFDTRVIPGHGPLSDRTKLIRFRDLLETVANRLQALIADGKTLEEIQASKPTAEFDEQWGSGFIKPDQWIEMIYRGMAQ